VFPQVPKRFTSGSQNVPQVLIVFLNTFPIAPQFYPKLVGLTSTSMYITCKGGFKGKPNYASALGRELGSIARPLCRGVPTLVSPW